MLLPTRSAAACAAIENNRPQRIAADFCGQHASVQTREFDTYRPEPVGKHVDEQLHGEDGGEGEVQVAQELKSRFGCDPC